MQTYGGDRFRADAPRRCGFQAEVYRRPCFCFLTKVWQQEVFAGMDQRAVGRILAAEGILLSERGRFTAKVRHDGKSMSVYAVPKSFIEGFPTGGEAFDTCEAEF